ncbi:hypothetical protein APHAL10511_002190 [Amanita phalloides]|nr:hypothetical protein APHAL10511_002190 [Amanita phalloides]
MFCLLDRIPKDLQQLILSQPPHQQCFMFGHDSTFTNSSFDLELRKVYSVHTTKHMDELPKQSFSKGEDGRCEIYDWNTRTILVDKFAGLVSRTLDDAHKQDSEIYDGEANASLLGIELNDPIYRLTFFPPNQPPAALDEHLVAFSLPGEAPPETAPPETALPTTVPPILRNYARPFKGVARPRYLPRGPPRRSGFPQPILATAPPDISKKLQTPTKFVSASTDPTVTSILSKIDYDDMEKCSSRFSANCFPIGSPSAAKDEDTKYLTSSLNGSDVIVSLSRNEVDSDSTDYIHLFEIRVPLGTAADHLFIKPLEIDSVEVLNTMRFTTDVGVDGNEIVIHLKPKAVSELSLLSHNPDMSVMIKGASVNPGSLDSTISIVELYTSKQGNARVALNYIHHIRDLRKNLCQ